MKIDSSLFSAGQHALNDAYGSCPKCSAELRLKHVNKSSFLSCSRYPDCDFTQSLGQTEVTTIKVMDDAACPQCEHALAVKKGRYGMFIGCTDFPTCTFIASKNEAKPSETHGSCPQCHSGQLVSRESKFGKKFIACDAYPKCKYIQS